MDQSKDVDRGAHEATEEEEHRGEESGREADVTAEESARADGERIVEKDDHSMGSLRRDDK